MDEFLSDLSIYSVLIPLLTGLMLWKIQDANARIMILLLVFASFSQIGGNYLPVERNIRYNLYTIADAIFWALLFFRITQGKKQRVIIFSLYSGLILYALIIYFTKGVRQSFHSEIVCLNNIIQVMCVLIYFYECYYLEKINRLADDPVFWFCISLLFYAPCTYFLFTYSAVYKKVPRELWNLHHIMNTLLYLIITVGFLVKIKTNKYKMRWI
jgi:heme/copper-type cytochrome/quinol oxidase subunit 4